MTTKPTNGGRSPAPSPQPPAPLAQRAAVCIATGFGIGLLTPAPGTVGTALWGLPVAWAVAQLPGTGWHILAIVLLFAVGVPIATMANRALGAAKDHQAIVWDEIVAMPVVFLIVPLTNWKIAGLGFLLFRLFDITKPPPARQLEHLPEGLGIMSDDFMAAVYAGLTLALVVWIDKSTGWDVLDAIRG
jgi:phosphatidylglycerophosphatase A